MLNASGKKHTLLFKNEKLREQFDLYGYVVVPFLTESEVNKLRELFFHTHPETPEGFYSSSFSNDERYKNLITAAIEEIADLKAADYFTGFKKLGSCFLVKKPGPESAMPVHQDWSIVDERHYDSITIWIPLQDVNERNGAIQVIDGSHRFSPAFRSPSLPAPFADVCEQLQKDLKLLPMKAGEAFIFSQALLHASPPNLSNKPRIAITYGLTDQRAEMIFHHYNEKQQLEEYKVDENFFKLYNTQIGTRPRFGELTRTFKYEPVSVTSTDYHGMKQDFQLKKSEAMYKMIPLFKDAARQKFFEDEGYAVFPLLNPQEVADLKNYQASLSLKDEKNVGFHVSMDNTDKEMCRKVREKIWGIVVPRLGEHLKDFKPFVASYVMKEINPKGVVPAHQDWSFVNNEEEGYCSITCWVALVDTNLDNGGMGVIRGSHKFMQNHRPSPSPQCPVPLGEHMFGIFPYLRMIDMKAGEVLMFDNRTFHASPPNTSNALRLAAGVGVTQKDAELVHYFMKPDGTFKTMLRYNVDEDFFLKYDNAALSKLYDADKRIEGYGEPAEVPYSFTKYTQDEMVALVKATGNEYNIPMTEKLAKLFGPNAGVQKKEEPVRTEPAVSRPEPVVAETVWTDDRSFAEKYTPLNIAREIKKRLTGV